MEKKRSRERKGSRKRKSRFSSFLTTNADNPKWHCS